MTNTINEYYKIKEENKERKSLFERAIENASKYFQRTLENTIPDFLEDIEGILEELKKGE